MDQMPPERDFYDQAKRDMERDGTKPSVEDLMASIDRYVQESIEAALYSVDLARPQYNPYEAKDYYRERMRLNLEALLARTIKPPLNLEGFEFGSTDHFGHIEQEKK